MAFMAKFENDIWFELEINILYWVALYCNFLKAVLGYFCFYNLASKYLILRFLGYVDLKCLANLKKGRPYNQQDI